VPYHYGQNLVNYSCKCTAVRRHSLIERCFTICVKCFSKIKGK